MTTDRQLMQQPLDALNHVNVQDRVQIIAALRERLAQPEQEPVAHTTGHCENHKQKGGCQLHNLQCGWPDCDRKPISTPRQMQPCAGRNCGSTNPNLHSAECFEDYEKSTRLAQPEQEPVALVIDGVLVKSELPEKYTGHLYTSPPQRKPLTDNELADLWYKQSLDWLEFARAVEAVHGIKENT